MPVSPVTLDDVHRARERIGGLIVKTPLLTSEVLTEVAGGCAFLKAENLQKTGSFKIRGAANKISSLSPEQRTRGVLAVSTGNHGQAVACVAQKLGIPAVICMSAGAAKIKVEAIKRYAAEVILHGHSYDEAEAFGLRLLEDRGLTLIPGFDDPHVIAGQGTIGLELNEDLPDLDTVVVPLSGGGLISGIAVAVQSTNPAVHVVGVSMDRAPVMYHSLRAGVQVEMAEEPTLADALVGGIGRHNQYTFGMVRQYVDEVVLVSEDEIIAAMAFMLEQHHLVVEGGGAVAVAALLHRKVTRAGRRIAVIVSGGNVDLPVLLRIAAGQSLEE